MIQKNYTNIYLIILTQSHLHKKATQWPVQQTPPTHIHTGIWCSVCLKPNSCYHWELYAVLHFQGFWVEPKAFIWEPSSEREPTVLEAVTYWLIVNISKPSLHINTWQVTVKYQMRRNHTQALKHDKGTKICILPSLGHRKFDVNPSTPAKCVCT